MPQLSNKYKLVLGALGILAIIIFILTFIAYIQISRLIQEEENQYIQHTIEKWHNWTEQNFSIVTNLADSLSKESKENRRNEKYQFFISEVTKSQNFLYLAYGLEDGYYTIDGWEIPDGYDPRTRPWYKTSKSLQAPVITWPFEGPKKDSPTYISLSSPIIKNEQFIGVVSSYVTMDFLEKNLLSDLIYRGGSAFLIDISGRILIHTDRQWVGKNLSEFDPLFSPKDTFPDDNYWASGTRNDYRITALENADSLLVLATNHGHQNQLLLGEFYFLLMVAPLVIFLILLSLYFYNKKIFLPIIHSLEHDANTKLLNKTHIKKKIDEHFLSKHKEGMLIIVSMDNFNQLSAAYPKVTILGLQNQIKTRIQQVMNIDSVLGFFSDNRFLLYSPFPVRDTELKQLKYLQELSDAVVQSYQVEDQELHCTFGIGASCFPFDSIELEQLIDNAFSAIASAREDKSQSYCLFVPEHNTQLGQAILMSNAIKIAIKNNEFKLVYQPQVDTKNRKTIGVEALIRWSSSELGRVVSPAEFIPVAEASNLIIEIGDYVINSVARQVSLWAEQGVDVGKVSINVSPRQLLAPDLLDKLLKQLALYNVETNKVELEITETTLMVNPEKSINVMNKLKKSGFCIAMDDFGTGYSSLEYLKTMPLDKLKIDRAFIKGLDSNSKEEVIVKMVMGMADALDYSVVAEGVENKEQLVYLQNNGCHLIQGYYFAKPMAPEQLSDFTIRT